MLVDMEVGGVYMEGNEEKRKIPVRNLGPAIWKGIMSFWYEICHRMVKVFVLFWRGVDSVAFKSFPHCLKPDQGSFLAETYQKKMNRPSICERISIDWNRKCNKSPSSFQLSYIIFYVARQSIIILKQPNVGHCLYTANSIVLLFNRLQKHFSCETRRASETLQCYCQILPWENSTSTLLGLSPDTPFSVTIQYFMDLSADVTAMLF